MSVQAMARVASNSLCKGPARFVLFMIANHETEERGAFPSVETLGRECGMSIRSVQRHIGSLVSLGELEVSPMAGPRGTNLYRSLPALSPRSPGTPDISGHELSPKRKERIGSSSSVTKTSSVTHSLVAILVASLRERGVKTPKDLSKWNAEAERLIRLDARDPTEAERVLRWSQSDPFWAPNILSMPKFRKQYDQLRLRMAAPSGRREETDEERYARLGVA